MIKVLTYLIMLLCLFIPITSCNKNDASCSAFKNEENIHFIFKAEDHTFSFTQNSILPTNHSQKWNRLSTRKNKLKTIETIINMGFTEEIACQFVFQGLNQKFNEIEKIINRDMKNARLLFDKDKGTFKCEQEVVGKKLNRKESCKTLVNMLKENSKVELNLSIDLEKPTILSKNLLANTNKKSTFSTYCGNSTEERISNIKTAFASISGLEIKPGETFSFNNATGVRTEKHGYKKAKIISNGSFIDGFGGGVCQASTTLYNSALLAGLEIVEVNQHSLPVSYVPPSQDAMVNFSSSDLKIKNNTNNSVFIRAYVKNKQFAVVELFGEKNKYDIKIKSKVTKIINKSPDEITTDISLCPHTLKKGETFRVSYAKDGMKSEAYLEKWKNNCFVSSERFRQNTYSPTKGVIVQC